MNGTLGLYGVMSVLGLCWGLGIPMVKLSVSTGFHPIAIVAWQSVYMTLFLTAAILVRGGSFALARRYWGLYLAIALFGTLIPNSASYLAAGHLPGGVMAIIIALVPMFAMPIALVLGMERWNGSRLLGLVLGAVAVVLLAGPDTSLPQGTALIFLAVALIAPFFYGVEGNYLAWRGTGGLTPIELLWGASIVSLLVSVPAAVGLGEWISPLANWDTPRWAILLSSVTHGIAYVGYFWLVGQAGAVFAAQVAYLVTAAGVLWSMVILGERYGVYVWLAFALMIIGVALVQPRNEAQDVRPKDA